MCMKLFGGEDANEISNNGDIMYLLQKLVQLYFNIRSSVGDSQSLNFIETSATALQEIPWLRVMKVSCPCAVCAI